MILDAYDPQCPIRNILARMSDKWSLLVIYALSQVEKMRFGDIRRAVPDISQKMLTVTLRTLEEDLLQERFIRKCRRVWNTRLRLGRIHFCRIFNR